MYLLSQVELELGGVKSNKPKKGEKKGKKKGVIFFNQILKDQVTLS